MIIKPIIKKLNPVTNAILFEELRNSLKNGASARRISPPVRENPEYTMRVNNPIRLTTSPAALVNDRNVLPGCCFIIIHKDAEHSRKQIAVMAFIGVAAIPSFRRNGIFRIQPVRSRMLIMMIMIIEILTACRRELRISGEMINSRFIGLALEEVCKNEEYDYSRIIIP